jgi:hypothetical protein
VTRAARTWIALLPAMTLPCLAAYVYFVLLAGNPAAQAFYAVTKTFTVLWPVVAFRFLLGGRFSRPTVDPRFHARAVPAGLALGAAIAAVILAAMSTPIGTMALASAPRIRDKAAQLGVLDQYVAFAIVLSLVHSLIEEYYWRWFVYGRLRQVLGRAPAHLLAGAAFAAHHVIVATQYFPFAWGVVLGSLVAVGGIFWSLMYERQRTLAGAWASHLVVDLAIMAIGYRILFGS